MVKPLALVLLAGCVSAAWGQLNVRVEDPQGRAVPGASVVLRDDSGSRVESRQTSAAGEAAFDSRGVQVEVRAAGFRPAAVDAEGRSEVVVALEIPPLFETLEVEGGYVELAPVATAAAAPVLGPQADLVESLRSLPHVNMLRRGGLNFEPVVQGLRETQVAMVVDGTRTFAAGPARMDSELSHVDAANVGAFEVVTGPYALTEGAGAMAAILVSSPPIPKTQGWRFGGRGGAGWRSNGAARTASLRVDGGSSKAGFHLRGSGDLLDDYNSGASGSASQLVPSDAVAHQLGAGLWFAPTANQEISLAGFYDEQTGVDYPGRLLTAEHFLMRAWRAGYRLARPEGLVSALKLTGFLNKKSHRMSNRGKPTAMDMPGRMPPFALDVSLPTEADTAGGAGRIELSPGEDWVIQAGFDYFRLEQDAQRYIARARDRRLMFSDAVWSGASLSDFGAYILAGRSFDRGEIRASGRIDWVDSDAGRPSDFFTENAGGELARSEANSNFSLAGRYEVGGGFTLSGGAGRVVRTANALERYSDRFPSTRFQVAAEFMGSPDIRPEASLQGDLAVEWRAGKYSLSAGGYVRSITNYITVEADPGLAKRLPLSPPVVFRYINGEGAFFRGWTLGFRRVGDGFEIRSQASKTMADDRELAEPVLGIPPLEVDSAVRYVRPSGRFWLEYGMRNVAAQNRIAATRLETASPGFTLHGIRAGIELWDGASVLHFGIENLGDKHYYEHLNSLNPFTRQRIPELGRAAVLGLTVTW